MDYLKERVRFYIRTTQLSFNDVLEILEPDIDSNDDSSVAITLTEIARFAREEMLLLEREMIGWPDVTDSDRLEAAFDNLIRLGIFALHNGACCAQCTVTDLPDEMLPYIDQGHLFHGYCYYHEQSTQSCLDQGKDGILPIYFGVELDDNRDTVPRPQDIQKIGQTVVTQLDAQGLKTVWDGDPNHAIEAHIYWRSRKVGKIPKKWEYRRLGGF